MITRIKMETEEIPTLLKCRIIFSEDGISFPPPDKPNQFNIEVDFDDYVNPKGIGITTDMTREEVGRCFIELGLGILKDNQ